MMPVVYNNGNEIMQAPGFVAFRNEMIHETRIIPLDGRSSRGRPAPMKSYMGDFARALRRQHAGRRTTNLNGKTGMQGNGMMLIPSDSIVISERFTPLRPDTLQYEVTINDPKTWTAPWKVSFPLKRDRTTRCSNTRATRATTRCATRCLAREPTKERSNRSVANRQLQLPTSKVSDWELDRRALGVDWRRFLTAVLSSSHPG